MISAEEVTQISHGLIHRGICTSEKEAKEIMSRCPDFKDAKELDLEDFRRGILEWDLSCVPRT